MDSKTVSKELRKEIRPLLKKAGFSAFTGRKAWRYSEGRVDVINFASIGSYSAGVFGIKSFSFQVFLGCYFPKVPDPARLVHIPVVNGQLRPTDAHCYFRGELSPGLTVVTGGGDKDQDGSIYWVVSPKKNELTNTIHHLRMKILSAGISWFDQFSNEARVLDLLLNKREDMQKIWGFGNNPSPWRSYLIGYFAMHLGRNDLAAHHLQKVVVSGSFINELDRIRSDLATLQ